MSDRQQVEQINRLVRRGGRGFLARSPRHAEFTLANIAVGTQEEPVSWQVPILSDFAVVVSVTSASPFVGLVSGAVKAGTKTPTGCMIIVANRSAASIGTAAFDVLAFPI